MALNAKMMRCSGEEISNGQVNGLTDGQTDYCKALAERGLIKHETDVDYIYFITFHMFLLMSDNRNVTN